MRPSLRLLPISDANVVMASAGNRPGARFLGQSDLAAADRTEHSGQASALRILHPALGIDMSGTDQMLWPPFKCKRSFAAVPLGA